MLLPMFPSVCIGAEASTEEERVEDICVRRRMHVI
jgi:hypothetical protein